MKLPLSHIWLPAKNPSKQLMVVLHGLGDSARGFIWLQDELDMDSFDYLLLNAPEPYYSGYRWYDITVDSLAGIVRSRQVLSEVFAATKQEGYLPERTFLLGFSQGSLMTLEFGSRHSDRLAGYVGISGYSIDPEAVLRDLNPRVNRGDWLITHGTKDDILPVEITRAQVKVLQAGGFKIDYREYPKVHNVDFEQELPEIRNWIADRAIPTPEGRG
jgi:phospholipase/carboxylesterase